MAPGWCRLSSAINRKWRHSQQWEVMVHCILFRYPKQNPINHCPSKTYSVFQKAEKNEICGQLCHNNVSSKVTVQPLTSCRIKTRQHDYLYRWQNWGPGRKLRGAPAQPRSAPVFIHLSVIRCSDNALAMDNQSMMWHYPSNSSLIFTFSVFRCRPFSDIPLQTCTLSDYGSEVVQRALFDGFNKVALPTWLLHDPFIRPYSENLRERPTDRISACALLRCREVKFQRQVSK